MSKYDEKLKDIIKKYNFEYKGLIDSNVIHKAKKETLEWEFLFYLFYDKYIIW